MQTPCGSQRRQVSPEGELEDTNEPYPYRYIVLNRASVPSTGSAAGMIAQKKGVSLHGDVASVDWRFRPTQYCSLGSLNCLQLIVSWVTI